jgi:hypothetical protein
LFKDFNDDIFHGNKIDF